MPNQGINYAIAMLILVLVIGALYTGIPVSQDVEVPKSVTDAGCGASYYKYLVPRPHCLVSDCVTEEQNEENAILEVALCLCDRYASDASESNAKLVVEWCDFLPKCSISLEDVELYCASA